MMIAEGKLREMAMKPCCPFHSVIMRFLYLVYSLEQAGDLMEGSTDAIEDFIAVIETAVDRSALLREEGKRGH